jgi:DNA-binding transcriptional regulator YdaS (Cro superfamily)
MDLKMYLDAQGPGAAAALARAIGGSSTGISLWANGKRLTPIERCLPIERATGGRVRAEDLRPDVDWSRGRRRAQKKASG